MIQFKKLSLQDCVYFRKAELNLDQGEILLINGKNLCSREPDQSNGSGKSLFFSYLPNILFASHPLAIRANAKKELFISNKAKATLELEIMGDHYQIEQSSNGTSVSYAIAKNGKPEQIRTTPLSEKYIQRILPISEAEFYTLIYLNSQRDFVFQRGKFEARLAFFTEFFRLDYYDNMRQYFAEELKKLKKLEIEVAAYESQRLKLNLDIKELDQQDLLDVDIEELEEKRAKFKDKRASFKEKLARLRQVQSHLRLVSQLKESLGGKRRVTDAQVEHIKEEVDRISNQVTVRKELKQLKKTCTDLLDARNAVQDELDSIYQALFNKDFDEPYELDYEVETEYREISAAYEKQKSLQLKEQDLIASLADYGQAPLTNEELLTESFECKQQIASYRKIQSYHAKDSKCPVCGTDLDITQAKRRASKAKKRLVQIERELQAYELSQGLIAIQAQIKKFPADLSNQFALIKAKYKKFAELKQHFSKVQRLSSRLSEVQRSYLQSKESFTQLKKELDQTIDVTVLSSLTDELGQAKHIAKLYQQLDKLEASRPDSDYVDLDLDQVQEKMDQLEDKQHRLDVALEKLADRINAYHIYEEKRKLLVSNLSDLSDKIEKLNGQLADKELLEILVRVYSNKGIKIQKINAICRLIEKNLNRFKTLLFGENFTFSLVVTEKSFDVLVDRGNSVVSDVRHLSGSESRRFNLLMLISLLPLTPKERRSNVIILDELEANGSPSTINMFCNHFIPELHKYVPNIIVISPLSLSIPQARTIYVVKDKKGSRLEE